MLFPGKDRATLAVHGGCGCTQRNPHLHHGLLFQDSTQSQAPLLCHTNNGFPSADMVFAKIDHPRAGLISSGRESSPETPQDGDVLRSRSSKGGRKTRWSRRSMQPPDVKLTLSFRTVQSKGKHLHCEGVVHGAQHSTDLAAEPSSRQRGGELLLGSLQCWHQAEWAAVEFGPHLNTALNCIAGQGGAPTSVG